VQHQCASNRPRAPSLCVTRPLSPGSSVQVIGNKWVTYLELLHDGHSESESFAELGLKRYCASARHTRFLAGVLTSLCSAP
jgi:DNA-directed RNA polymerase subunit N (RpoN/RPB10)